MKTLFLLIIVTIHSQIKKYLETMGNFVKITHSLFLYWNIMYNVFWKNSDNNERNVLGKLQKTVDKQEKQIMKL